MFESSRNRIWAAIAAGVLLVLATPPVPLGFLAWFALIPFLLAIESSTDGAESFRLGMWTGLIFHLGTIYWIAFNTGADWGARLTSASGTILVLTFWFGMLAWLHRLALKRYGRGGHLAVIFLWPAQEFVFFHGELAFPWASLALTQSDYLSVMQLAAVGGTPLVTAWVASINGIAAAGIRKKRTGLVLVLLVVLTLVTGMLRERAVALTCLERPIGEVALVQGNVDPALKWKLGAEYSLNLYWSLTGRILEENDPLLVVWPETAAPVYLKRSRQWRTRMQNFVDSTGLPVATGSSHYEMEGETRLRYNSAFLIRPGKKGSMDWYAKVHLVPFGERVPFQKVFPGLGRLNFGQAEFKPGPGMTAWTITNNEKPVKVSPLICYEMIFPDLGREVVRLGADFMINHTNDGWLAGTSEPHQHLNLSRYRCLETGRALVRATNTGISAFILPTGRIIKRLPEGVRGVLVDKVPEPVDTPYNRGGWVLGYILAAGALAIYGTLVVKLLVRKWSGTGKTG